MAHLRASFGGAVDRLQNVLTEELLGQRRHGAVVDHFLKRIVDFLDERLGLIVLPQNEIDGDRGDGIAHDFEVVVASRRCARPDGKPRSRRGWN